MSQVEYSGAGQTFSGSLAQFKTMNFSLYDGQEYYIILTPIDVNQKAYLKMKRL